MTNYTSNLEEEPKEGFGQRAKRFVRKYGPYMLAGAALFGGASYFLNKNQRRYELDQNGEIRGCVDIRRWGRTIASCGFSTEKEEMELGSLESTLLYVDPRYGGRGLGTRVAREALGYGLEVTEREGKNIRSVWAIIGRENVPSRRIFENLGFEEVYDNEGSLYYSREVDI